MVEKATKPKVILSKEYIDKVKEYEQKNPAGGFYLSDDYLTSTNGFVIIRIPSSQIKNIGDLNCKNQEMKEFSYFANKFIGVTNLNNLKFENMSDYLIKQEINFGIREIDRKLTRYECNQRVQSCSIAQGLLLGRDYDHCGHCSSNYERLFLKPFLSSSFKIDKKESFGDTSIVKEPNRWMGYFSLMHPDIFKSLYNFLREIPFDVEISIHLENNDWEEELIDCRSGNLIDRSYSAVKERLDKSLEEKIRFNNPWFKLTSNTGTNTNEINNRIEVIGVSQICPS